MGTKVCWENPTKAAVLDRPQKSHVPYCKLQHLWRSRLCWKTKVHLFHSYIVPVLLYSLATLTLEDKHMTSIDGWCFKYLRRCMGIKASYYSHIPNRTVWIKASRPTLLSQILLSQAGNCVQNRTLTQYTTLFSEPDTKIGSVSPIPTTEDTRAHTGSI